jgi:dipeptidyl-peptidase 4
MNLETGWWRIGRASRLASTFRPDLPFSNGNFQELESGPPHCKQTIGPISNGNKTRCSRFSGVQKFLLLVSALPSCAVAGPLSRSAQASAPAKTLTVERIYSSPSLSGSLTEGIEWAPDSKRISYFQDGASGEELWTMDAASGDRRVLVKADVLRKAMPPPATSAIQSTGLGRVHTPDYFWDPDGTKLLFAGGSSLVLLSLKTMSAKPLVDGAGGGTVEIEDPKFSPNGKWVSFVRDSNLWIANVETGEVRALTTGGSEEILKGKLDWVYPEELDLTSAYWWSPDSSKIAFYEMDERSVTRYPIMDMSSPLGAVVYTRYPQAGEANPIVRVGVVSVADPASTGAPTWMDTGANTDVYLARVEWLADSERVAIERLNRAQNRLDLLFCDAASGASKAILTETDKYWINVADDLYFFSDDKRFLWSSERTGFRHYYLYDLSGKLIEQLTSGDWSITGNSGFGPGAVAHPAVDESRGTIYFISNKDDVRERQLYRLSLQDKSILRVTRDAGTHDVIIAPDTSAYVDESSTAMTPPRQALCRIDGSRTASINDNPVPELAGYHLLPVQFLTVDAADGTKLEASMIRPPNFDPSRKYPVLVDVYGGPDVQNVTNSWGREDFLWDEMMAQKGYIIFTLDNRGSKGRGHAFETPVFHQLGKIELQDQLSGVKYLKSLGYIDDSRIGVWGWSYGGTMTLQAMFNAANVFKVGAAVAPVSDWHLYDTIYTERYMGKPQDNPVAYQNSSPLNQANQLTGKLLLAHGTGDDNVHFANTSEVINELIIAGRYPSDLLVFPGRGHPISDAPARIQLFNRIADFFLSNL